MTRSLAFPALLLSALLLAACQPTAPAADADAPAQAAATGPSAEAQAAAASAAAAAGAAMPDAAAPGAEAGVPPVPAPVEAAPPAGWPVEGKDYVAIENPEPYQPLDGKIEVVEVFGYVCPACARFEPMFSAWKARQPADVRVTYVPAPFGPQWMPYARSFYVAEAQGLVEKTHTPLFHAIHLAQTLPGEGKKPDEQAVATWYGQYGADPKRFLADMHSFGTEAKIKRGQQFMVRTQVGGTPTVVVDGKYRVLGKSYEDMLRITDALVSRERAARGAGTP